MLIYKVLYGTVRGVLEHNAGLVGAMAVKESTAKVRSGGSGGVGRSLQLSSMHFRAPRAKPKRSGPTAFRTLEATIHNNVFKREIGPVNDAGNRSKCSGTMPFDSDELGFCYRRGKSAEERSRELLLGPYQVRTATTVGVVGISFTTFVCSTSSRFLLVQACGAWRIISLIPCCEVMNSAAARVPQ